MAALSPGVRDHMELATQDGATAAEYAIMVALIALVIFSTVALLGSTLGSSFECTESRIADPTIEEC